MSAPAPSLPAAPPFPAARLAQAVERQNAGDLAGAQALYWQILFDDPRQFDALHLMGVSHCQQGAHGPGTWFIRRALDVRDEPSAHFNLATALAQLHRHDLALAAFDRALALQPGYPEAWAGRGDALQNMGRNPDAIASYHRALGQNPRLPGTIANLGTALLATGQAAEAITLFRRALDGGAAPTPVLVNIARAEQELGLPADATWAEACRSDPHAADPRWQHAMALLPDIPGDTAQADASRPAFAAALDALADWHAADATGRRDPLVLSWPFFLAYQDHDNRALMRRFGDLRATLMGQWRQAHPLPPPGPAEGGPLRVAVVSPHLYSHSVWHALIRGLFAHADPGRVALHAFHTGTKSDAHTAFARDRAASFTIGERPLEHWAQAIQAVRPDAILYPAIGLDFVSANLASLRLARFQLASWGHPETTGLPTVDAYLSAAAFEAEGSSRHYTERLVALPGLGASFVPQAAAPVPPNLDALGLDAGRPIVLCPGTPFKYAPAHDATLAAIAAGIPGAQLVFFGMKDGSPKPARLVRRIAAAFAARGLDPQAHLRLVPFQPIGSFYGLLRRATLCLDTIGFSGFNTALQVLDNGCPLVAFEGRFMRGRLASAILRTIGLDDLVATTPAGFVAIAVRLAADPGRRAAVTRHLARALPLVYDDRAPVDALTALVETSARSAGENRQKNAPHLPTTINSA